MKIEIPQSAEIEKALLGSILVSAEDAMAMIAGMVSEDDFYLDSNRMIFTTVLAMLHDGEPVDISTVVDRLKSIGNLRKAGGAAHISSITDGAMCGDSKLLAGYCRILRQKSGLRRILNLAENISSKAGGADTVADLVSQAHRELDDISRRQNSSEEKTKPLLVTAKEFLSRGGHNIDWLIQGVVQRGANGFVVASPKTGKSWVAVDMCISIALGLPWMGIPVPQAERVALITREDQPGLTKFRMRKLLDGNNKNEEDLGDMLYVNSKDQSPQFKLDMPEQLAEMMTELRARQPQFVILDVLNVMHSKDENDNTQMRAVLDCAESIHRELRCALCILHHFNKQASGRLTDRMRGAGAMAGFAEWIIGIEFASDKPDEKVRYLEFDLKAASPHKRIYYEIWGNEELPQLGCRIECVDWEGTQATKRSARRVQ